MSCGFTLGTPGSCAGCHFNNARCCLGASVSTPVRDCECGDFSYGVDDAGVFFDSSSNGGAEGE